MKLGDKIFFVAWMVLAFSWVVGCSYGIYYSYKHPSPTKKVTVVKTEDNNTMGPSLTGQPFIVEYAEGLWGPM